MATNYAFKVNAPLRVEGGAVAIVTAATTQASLAFGTAVRIWVQTDTHSLVAFGPTGVAAPTTSDARLVANQDYIFDLRANQTPFARVKLDAGATAGRLRWRRVA